MAGALMTVTTGTGGITATVAAVGLCLSIGAGNVSRDGSVGGFHSTEG